MKSSDISTIISNTSVNHAAFYNDKHKHQCTCPNPKSTVKYCVNYLMDDRGGDPQKQGDTKYCMFVYQDANTDDNELIVVIGQNPGACNQNGAIDRTNQNIFFAITQGLKKDRYLMFNTFPTIKSSVKNKADLPQKPYHLNNIRVFCDLLDRIKKQEPEITIKIVFACGNTLYIYYPFVEMVYNYLEDDMTYAFEYQDQQGNSYIKTHFSPKTYKGEDYRTYTLKNHGIEAEMYKEYRKVKFN